MAKIFGRRQKISLQSEKYFYLQESARLLHLADAVVDAGVAEACVDDLSAGLPVVAGSTVALEVSVRKGPGMIKLILRFKII